MDLALFFKLLELFGSTLFLHWTGWLHRSYVRIGKLTDLLPFKYGQELFIVVNLIDDGRSCLTTALFLTLVIHLRPFARLSVHLGCSIALLSVIHDGCGCILAELDKATRCGRHVPFGAPYDTIVALDDVHPFELLRHVLV